MNVKELIEQLKQIDENLPVVVSNGVRSQPKSHFSEIKGLSSFELEKADGTKEIVKVVCLSKND